MLHAFLLAAALTGGPTTPATAPKILTCSIDPIEIISITPTDLPGASFDNAVRVAFDQADLDQLFSVRGDEVALLRNVPLPGGTRIDLELERFSIAASGGSTVFVDGVPQTSSLMNGSALFTGQIAGQPGSDVFLAASTEGTRGWLRLGADLGVPRLVHLIAEPDASGDWQRSTTLIVDEAALGLPPANTCQTDELPNGGKLFDAAPKPALHDTNLMAATGTVLRELTIAVETDHQLFQLFGTQNATQAYVVALMGAVSARYREQVDVIITLPYLGIYSNAGDPWVSQDQGGNAGNLLDEFRGKWYPNAPVQASLSHFISGADLGGGVAYLDTICIPEYQFGVSGNIGGNVPFPVSQGPLNWDFMVVAHELGHNVATPHTHDFCPPLDSCAPFGSMGQCQSQVVCIPTGTLMSYCHACDGNGVANITTYFHPTVVDVMKNRIVNSCLPPFEGILTQDLGGGVIGVGGVPKLTPSWDKAGDALSASYSGAPAGSNGALVVSAAAYGQPMFGGILWPFADLLLFYNTPIASGTLGPHSFAGYTFPAGFGLVMQSWYVDPIAPAGFSGSNGLRVEVVIPEPPMPLTWHRSPISGKEYAVTPPGTWHKGRQLGLEHGGDLASIDSAALETWLRQTFFDAGLVSGTVYIGMTDNTSEGSFKWSNGNPVFYTNWAGGEPNDWNGFEDYASWAGGAWNDLSGFDDLPALIER